MIIGLAGKKQSGKNTVATLLQDKFGVGGKTGFHSAGFADSLRELAIEVNPTFPEGSYVDLVSELGYEEAKKIDNVRKFLQNLGVGVRRVLGEDTWVNKFWKENGDKVNLAVTDVRFENESKSISNKGGVVIEVVNSRSGSDDEHVSEQPLPRELISGYMHNEGSIEDLRKGVDTMAIYLGLT